MEELLDSLEDKSALKPKDIFLRIWTEPKQVFSEIDSHPYTSIIHVIFFISGLGSLLGLGQSYFFDKAPVVIKIILEMFAGGCLAIFAGYVSAFFVYRVGRWFTGKASFKDILKLTAFSYIPSICIAVFQIPFFLVSKYASNLFPDGSSLIHNISIAISIMSFILSCWALVIFVIGLSVVQKFTTGKAILNLVIVLIIAFFVSLAITLSFFSFYGF